MSIPGHGSFFSRALLVLPVHILLSKISPGSPSGKPARSTFRLLGEKLNAPFFLLLLVVGLGRVELPTSPLSGVRSSHLSYRPGSLPLVELIGLEPTTS